MTVRLCVETQTRKYSSPCPVGFVTDEKRGKQTGGRGVAVKINNFTPAVVRPVEEFGVGVGMKAQRVSSDLLGSERIKEGFTQEEMFKLKLEE